MKTYLLSAFALNAGHVMGPVKGVYTLASNVAFDVAALERAEAHLLKRMQAAESPAGPRHDAIAIHSFQLLEETPPVPPAGSLTPEELSLHHRWVEEVRALRGALDELKVPVAFEGVIPTVTRLLRNQAALNSAVQLNECSVVMPPVDSPVLIEIAPGVLLLATRPAHAAQREASLLFNLDAGGTYTGRPRWTHP